MHIRKQYAELFYTGDIEEQIKKFVSGLSYDRDFIDPFIGVVPHAGWQYSGKVAAKVINLLAQKHPDVETIIILGTVHNTRRVSKHSLFLDGGWSTPRGVLEVDQACARMIYQALANELVEDRGAHDYEHSIEVQLPFIEHFWPSAKIVPIAIVPEINAVAFGQKLSKVITENNIDCIVIATTDLTHYGENYGFMPAGTGDQALEWVHENDRTIIEKSLRLEAEGVLHEARARRNACGPGALASALALAKELGSTQGFLMDYTTSHEVVNDGSEFTFGVGYAGIIFERG